REKCGTTGVPTATACAMCGGRLVQRTDDNASVVLDRLRVYERQSRPLVDYYQDRPTFRSIDGAQTPDGVAAGLAAAGAARGEGAGSSADPRRNSIACAKRAGWSGRC